VPTPPPVPPPGSARLKLLNAMTGAHVRLYRISGGRLGGRMEGAPILLLDHVGRKSGKARTAPLIYATDGDDLVIVASRGGSDAMPAWWLNLKDGPRTTVQVGAERRSVVARQASPEEKQRLWPMVCDTYSDYAVYQRRTTREIPVIVLAPA
jgi:F420H(2)-dependent quinone reductase